MSEEGQILTGLEEVSSLRKAARKGVEERVNDLFNTEGVVRYEERQSIIIQEERKVLKAIEKNLN